MKTEIELRQMFRNLSDCYADTWHSERGFMEEGDVVQAMTENRFIEVVQQVLHKSCFIISVCECEIPYFPTGNIHWCSKCNNQTVY